VAHITIHVRKARTKSLGTTYVGYIRVVDGPSQWRESTGIHRLTRADALYDADATRTALLLQTSGLPMRLIPKGA
jgi:hypothetical protein